MENVDPIVTEVPGAPAPSAPAPEPQAPAQPENPGDANNQQAAPAPEPSKDPAAAHRFAMMNERKAREAAEKRASELEAKLKETKPEFNSENDPDGTKQVEYLAERKAAEMLENKLRELGLDEKLDKIEQARVQDEFFSHVQEAAKEFSHMGITVTKDELKSALERFETKGITAQELVVLAKLPMFVKASKPAMPAPGAGARAPVPSDAPLTHEQNQNRILAKFGISPD